MKKVVSVSLGSSTRDKTHRATILGQEFEIERRGTDGDLHKFEDLFEELDGKVDALGVGGADLWLVIGRKRYAFKEIHSLVQGAKTTPVVDGSGLKHTLERAAIHRIGAAGLVDWESSSALLVSAVDRFGMAQSLAELCPRVTYGDLCFGLGLPFPVRSIKAVERIGKVLLPVVTNLPFKWFYPTGPKQTKRDPKYPKLFQEADVICGDWHYIRRYAPDKLRRKTVITQTLREADYDWLKTTDAKQVIATTPMMDGGTFATNVMEGVIVAMLGKRPEDIQPTEYLDVLERLEWEPTATEL